MKLNSFKQLVEYMKEQNYKNLDSTEEKDKQDTPIINSDHNA